jgi:hypothetical protein
MKKLISLGSILLCSCVAMLMAENPSTIRRLPSVVAQRSFIGQTTAIPPTTLFTPCSKGIYRVTVSIEQSNTAGGYGPEAFLSWTGDFASYQEQVNGGNVYSGKAAANSFELTIHSAAGQPIQLNTVVNANEQGTYNLYVVVEKL